jgi:hypothetical protein
LQPLVHQSLVYRFADGFVSGKVACRTRDVCDLRIFSSGIIDPHESVDLLAVHFGVQRIAVGGCRRGKYIGGGFCVFVGGKLVPDFCSERGIIRCDYDVFAGSPVFAGQNGGCHDADEDDGDEEGCNFEGFAANLLKVFTAGDEPDATHRFFLPRSG